MVRIAVVVVSVVPCFVAGLVGLFPVAASSMMLLLFLLLLLPAPPPVLFVLTAMGVHVVWQPSVIVAGCCCFDCHVLVTCFVLHPGPRAALADSISSCYVG